MNVTPKTAGSSTIPAVSGNCVAKASSSVSAMRPVIRFQKLQASAAGQLGVKEKGDEGLARFDSLSR